MQEWVVSTYTGNNKLMGGSYLSSNDAVTSKSVFYVQEETTVDPTFGLRTVFNAENFLSDWKTCIENTQ